MPFVYRLQKILDFRIRKKEEQLIVVQNAQQALFACEENIRKNNEEIEDIKVNQRKADYKMMEYYDKYLHHLWEKGEKLEEARMDAEYRLKEEMKILVELEQAVKVLEKHKEKNKEAYVAEEKSAELRKYSELGVQRYFQQSERNKEEEEMQLQLEKMKEDFPDEY